MIISLISSQRAEFMNWNKNLLFIAIIVIMILLVSCDSTLGETNQAHKVILQVSEIVEKNYQMSLCGIEESGGKKKGYRLIGICFEKILHKVFIAIGD